MIFNVRLGEDRPAYLVIVGVSPTIAKRSLPYCRSVSMKSQRCILVLAQLGTS